MLKKLLAIVLMLCATLAMAAVDVNKATEAELDSIKGIGPSTSKTIISERKKGEFKSWGDFIARVKGVGEDKATKFSAEGLTVNGAAYKKEDDKPAASAKPAASGAKPAATPAKPAA